MTLGQIFLLGIYARCVIGAPYGPSGTLSLYRSIQYGWRVGAATAIGSLLAILLFSFLSAMFIEFSASYVGDQQLIDRLRLGMGLVLFLAGLLFAYSSIRSNPANDQLADTKVRAPLTSVMSAFVVGLVSGKNVIGFPTFLIATEFMFDDVNPVLSKASAFSAGSLFSSAILYFLLIASGVRWGPVLFASVMPIMRYMVAFLFVGLGIYLIAQGLS